MATSKAKAAKDSTRTGSSVPGMGDGKSCVVSSGTKIEGNFHSKENIRLDGTVSGELICDKKMVLGPQGKVEGNLNAQDAVIMGHVDGDLNVKGLLTLESSSVIIGNIKAGRIQVQEGARYEGTCHIGGTAK